MTKVSCCFLLAILKGLFNLNAGWHRSTSRDARDAPSPVRRGFIRGKSIVCTANSWPRKWSPFA